MGQALYLYLNVIEVGQKRDTQALYLYSNVVPAAAPESGALYLYSNVVSDNPCPWISTVSADPLVVGSTVTLTGRGFEPAGEDTGPEVRAYESADFGSPYTVMGAVSAWTNEQVTVSVPGGMPDRVFLAVVHTGVDASPLCPGSNFRPVSVSPFDPPAEDRDAGWWVEVWDLANSVRLHTGIPALTGSFQAPLLDIGDGSVVLPASYVWLRNICDPSKDKSTLIKVYSDKRYRYSFFADQISDPYGEQGSEVVTISGPGLEGVGDWGRLFPWDFDPASPNQPTAYPDWNYTYSVEVFDGFELDEEPEEFTWSPRAGGSINDETGLVTPAGTHTGVEAIIEVQPGERFTATVYVEGVEIGQRITLGADLGKEGVTVYSANSFLFDGAYLTELGNVPRNPAGNGCPGGSTDGTEQSFTIDLLVPEDVSSLTLFVQSDHHSVCGAPGNAPFKITGLELSGVLNIVPNGWTSVRATEFRSADERKRSGDWSLYLKGDTDTGALSAISPKYAVPKGAPLTFTVFGDHSGLARLVITKANDTNDALASSPWMAGTPGTWTQHTVEWLATRKNVRVKLQIQSGQGIQEVYWDDLAIVVGLAPTTPGEIVSDMLAAMQARGTLSQLTIDFDHDYDSGGFLWSNAAVALNFGHGQTLAEVLDQLVGQGFEWRIVPRLYAAGQETGYLLQLFNGRADSDAFGVGEHQELTKGSEAVAILEGSILPGGQTTHIVPPNVVLSEGGENVDGETLVNVRADDDAVIGVGRREDFLTNSSALDGTALAAAGRTRLRNLRRTSRSASIELLEGSLYRPFLDFEVGDSIRADLGDRLPDSWYRVAAIRGSFSGEDDQIRWVIDLGNVTIPEDAVVAVTLARLVRQAGSAVTNTGTGNTGDTTSGAVPILIPPTDALESHTHPLTQISPAGVSGDLSGELPSPTVKALRGRTVASAKPFERISDVLVWDEDQTRWEPGRRDMRWLGDWDPLNEPFQLFDVVLDDGWLMVANKETGDRPAPQAIGEPYWGTGLGDSPAWNEPTVIASQVVVGVRFTSDGFWASVARFWAVAGQTYTFFSVAEPTGPTPQIQWDPPITATQTGWVEIPIGQTAIPEGSTFDLGVAIAPGAPGVVQIAGDWLYVRSGGAAGSGEIWHGGSGNSQMTIHQEDDGGSDRSADLDLLDPGDTIEASGQVWDIVSIEKIGSVYWLTVTPNTRISAGLYTFTFETVVDELIAWQEIPNGWVSAPNASGFFSTSGYGDIVLDDDQYGVDLLVQDAYVSPDWDLMAYTQGLAGGGGGASFSPLCLHRHRGGGGTQAIPTGVDTRIDLPVVELDEASAFLTWNGTLLQFEVQRDCLVSLGISVQWAGNGTGNRRARVVQNGTVIMAVRGDSAGSTDTYAQNVSMPALALAAGDTIVIEGLQTSGGDLNLGGSRNTFASFAVLRDDG